MEKSFMNMIGMMNIERQKQSLARSNILNSIGSIDAASFVYSCVDDDDWLFLYHNGNIVLQNLDLRTKFLVREKTQKQW